LKRTLQSLFIVVCLLIVQQTGYIHELSHLDRNSPASQHKHSPHTKACIECGLLAQLGTGLASKIATPHTTNEAACASSHSLWVYYTGIPRRFQSRAPPCFPLNRFL
jgi:hypothetical protein